MTNFEHVMGYLLSSSAKMQTDKDLEFGLTILLDALEDLKDRDDLARVDAWFRRHDVTRLHLTYRTGILRFTARWRKEIPSWQEAVARSFEHVRDNTSLEEANQTHRGLLL